MVKLAVRISQPRASNPIVDDGKMMTQEFRSWVRIITERSLMIGSGSPDGVVSAPQGAQYMDESGSSGSILWLKRASDIGGDVTLGWVLV